MFDVKDDAKGGFRRIEVLTGPARRRRWSAEDKAVESRRGAVSPKQPVSPPRSSNRTCGFPASGFPTGFIAGIRRVVT